MARINPNELEDLKVETNKKFERVDYFMFTVVFILVIMVANILITLTMWFIDIRKASKQPTINYSVTVPSIEQLQRIQNPGGINY